MFSMFLDFWSVPFILSYYSRVVLAVSLTNLFVMETALYMSFLYVSLALNKTIRSLLLSLSILKLLLIGIFGVLFMFLLLWGGSVEYLFHCMIWH